MYLVGWAKLLKVSSCRIGSITNNTPDSPLQEWSVGHWHTEYTAEQSSQDNIIKLVHRTLCLPAFALTCRIASVHDPLGPRIELVNKVETK